jgi:hypothetical protein
MKIVWRTTRTTTATVFMKGKNKKKWFNPGSNWRPSVCKTEIITTRPLNLSILIVYYDIYSNNLTISFHVLFLNSSSSSTTATTVTTTSLTTTTTMILFFSLFLYLSSLFTTTMALDIRQGIYSLSSQIPSHLTHVHRSRHSIAHIASLTVPDSPTLFRSHHWNDHLRASSDRLELHRTRRPTSSRYH